MGKAGERSAAQRREHPPGWGRDGNRVRKVWEHSGVRDERIYLGAWEVYRRWNGSTKELERETLHVMDGVRRVAMVETKTVDSGAPPFTPTPRLRLQLTNHLQTAHLEVDGTGLVISYEEMTPYGTSSYRSATSAVEVSARRYRYTGKERDEETGLDYFGARYYAPWLGRWTTADPLGLQAGLNLYLYGRASPVVFIDPSGTQEKKAGILDVNVTELDREVGSAVGSFIHAVTPGFLIADALGADTKGSLQRLATGPTKALAERGEAAVKATTTAASLSAGPIGWVSGALTHEEGLAGYTKDVAGVGLGVARLPAAGADLISGLGLGIVGAAAAGSDEEALYHATNATLSAADLAALTALASGVAAEAKQLANAVESGGPAAGSPKGGGGGRTVFRALNPDDVSRLEQGLGIRPKGVKGTPAQHVVGEKPTKYVSASETQAGAERFETPGQGIVEIDVGRAIQGGSKIVEGPEITKSIRAELKGEQRRRAVRDTERVNEVLFEDGIPFDAIIKWLRD